MWTRFEGPIDHRHPTLKSLINDNSGDIRVGRLITGAGYTGTIGGNITVYGTPERQTITVADVAGTVTFDPSFNKGGDTIVLAKSASAYT
ncbi:MAG: hypothetical protein ACKOAN_10030, partial [Chakrabartia sp.]